MGKYTLHACWCIRSVCSKWKGSLLASGYSLFSFLSDIYGDKSVIGYMKSGVAIFLYGLLCMLVYWIRYCRETDHVLYPDIRQMPGHENISTTSGFYAFVTLDTLAKALERTNPEGRNAEKNWKDKKISEPYIVFKNYTDIFSESTCNCLVSAKCRYSFFVGISGTMPIS